MKYGTPEIMNTDQGSQFTSSDFIGLVKLSPFTNRDGICCFFDHVS